MRLFYGLRFRPETLDAVEALQADLLLQGMTGRITRRENLHLTLAFLGELPAERVPILRELLRLHLTGFSGQALPCGSLGIFPGRILYLSPGGAGGPSGGSVLTVRCFAARRVFPGETAIPSTCDSVPKLPSAGGDPGNPARDADGFGGSPDAQSPPGQRPDLFSALHRNMTKTDPETFVFPDPSF